MGCRDICFRFGSFIQMGIYSTCASWVPVALILVFAAWSWYAYVISICVQTIDSAAQFGVYLAVYHILLILMLTNYYRSARTPPDPIPELYRLPREVTRELDVATTVEERNQLLLSLAKKRLAHCPPQLREYSGGIRYCHDCQILKPDRCHHCSICQTCVLRMDHHCPWINNCVHFGNHKFFIIFLFWGAVFTFFIAMTDLEFAIPIWKEIFEMQMRMDVRTFHVMALPIVTVPFFGLTFGFFCMCLPMLFHNETTLENMSYPIFASGHVKHGFNIGCRGNFAQVFGSSPLLWCLPVRTEQGNGCVYPAVEHTELNDIRV